MSDLVEPDDDLYEAMMRRDTCFDGRYLVGIVSTGIVCFPSCRSRLPKRENIRVYESLGDAIAEDYRPCKRCKPDNPHRQSPDEEIVYRVTEVLSRRMKEGVTLPLLARELNMSPYHLQRIYKRYVGTTPAKKLTEMRLEAALQMLLSGEQSIRKVGNEVGFRNAAHFSTAFSKAYGITPGEYRRRGVTHD